MNFFRRSKKPSGKFSEEENELDAKKPARGSGSSTRPGLDKLLKGYNKQYGTYKSINKLQKRESKQDADLQKLLVVYRDYLNREINNVGDISKHLKEQSRLFKNIIQIHSKESKLMENQNSVVKKLRQACNISQNFKQMKNSSGDGSADLATLNTLVMEFEASINLLASNTIDMLKLDKKNLLADARKIRDLSSHDHFKIYQKHRKQTIDSLNSVIKHLEESIKTETLLSESVSEMKANLSKIRANVA